MTREEQIIEAAEKATYQKPPQYSELVHKARKVMNAYEVGFIDGCVWADQHPQWIPVDEELPPPNEGAVLAVDDTGYVDKMIYTNDGWENSKRWCAFDAITHWMPLPMPPQGKEANNEH